MKLLALIVPLFVLPYAITKHVSKDAICNRSYFDRKFTNENKNINDEEYKRLRNCKLENNQCTGYPGTFTVTYAEDEKKRYLVVLNASDISQQGCWGYSLNIVDDVTQQTIYFNMDGSTDDFLNYHFIKLGFNYKFTLTPLPSGNPMVVETKAPSLCEMEVLETLRKRLERKELFQKCESPGFNERFEVAEKLCKLYPDTDAIIPRTKAARNRVVENDCTFELLEDNILS